MTSVLTTKHTCDSKGNWTEVSVVLTRSGKGWVERSPGPSAGVVRRDAAWAPKPAVVKKDRAA